MRKNVFIFFVLKLAFSGASVHAVSEGDFSETIVHCASVHPTPAIVYKLLEQKGAQFARVDAEGSNAMHILVGFDSVFSKPCHGFDRTFDILTRLYIRL